MTWDRPAIRMAVDATIPDGTPVRMYFEEHTAELIIGADKKSGLVSTISRVHAGRVGKGLALDAIQAGELDTLDMDDLFAAFTKWDRENRPQRKGPSR